MRIIYEYVNKIFNIYFLITRITFLMRGYVKIGYE